MIDDDDDACCVCACVRGEYVGFLMEAAREKTKEKGHEVDEDRRPTDNNRQKQLIVPIVRRIDLPTLYASVLIERILW